MKQKKEKIIILGLILLMIIAVVGVSYAAFSYTDTGTKVNSITSGAIMMTYTESDNIINMSGALPTTDKTGTVRLNEGEYFDFTISSTITGNVNINYEISAKDITTSDRKIDGSNIKLYLTKLNSDGSEEALMLPETYSEETNANNYTGRPAGEMSLYTSSMSSSETNNYRLRMYVTEEYNPQGDGGNLQFSVQINVYGKDGDKYVPLTTEQLLAANPVQEDTTNMFNYASNGTQYDPNDEEDYATDPNPEYITSGLYQSEDEDGVSYYFRGNVTNNNVQFGEYQSDYYVYFGNNTVAYYQSDVSCEEDGNSRCTQFKLASAGDKMYWKIIRANGDGSLRLIYNGTSANPGNSSLEDSYVIGITSYNLKSNDPKYTGYTYDNGIDSFIKKEVDTWYQNALGNTIYDDMVIGGRFCSDSSGYIYDGQGDFTSFDRLWQSVAGYAKANAPTLKCPTTSESYGGSYRLKAGLITADELVLAGENPGLYNDSYLNRGEYGKYYWTMTPAGFYEDGIAFVWFENYFLISDYVHNDFAVRPVINVLTNNGFTSGDGSITNPYILS